MGVRIIEGILDGTTDAAVLVDSCSSTAFGPLFDDADEAHGFLAWLGIDARKIDRSQLAGLLVAFRSGATASESGVAA